MAKPHCAAGRRRIVANPRARDRASSLTHKGPLQQSHPTATGTYQERAPFVASPRRRQGTVISGITQEYLIGQYAYSTLDGVVLDRGINGTPSHGYRLLENALAGWPRLRWPMGHWAGRPWNIALLLNPNKVEKITPNVLAEETRISGRRAGAAGSHRRSHPFRPEGFARAVG